MFMLILIMGYICNELGEDTEGRFGLGGSRKEKYQQKLLIYYFIVMFCFSFLGMSSLGNEMDRIPFS